MIKDFSSSDVYMLAGLYFLHDGSVYLGIVTIIFSIIDAIACLKKKGQP